MTGRELTADEIDRILGFDVEDDHGDLAYYCPHGQPLDLCWQCECWSNSLREVGAAINAALVYHAANNSDCAYTDAEWANQSGQSLRMTL